MSQPTTTSPAQQTGARDMVYCHECENEWYRDEHGLTCPECQSDFTEIIEADHDPRNELIDMPDSDGEESPAHPLHDHNPWDHAADPEEGNINTIRWQQTGPGRFSTTATFYRNLSSNGRGGDHQHHDGQNNNGDPLTQNFVSMLSGILGGGTSRPPGGPFHQTQPTADDGAPGPRATGADQPSGGPRIQILSGSGNGGRFTYSTSARIFPRDANNPQPHVEPVDDLSRVIGTLMAGLGGGGGPFQQAQGPNQTGGGQQIPPNPLAALFANILNPGGAPMGDFVHTQEALDRVISQLMEQNASGNAPGPASADAIASLSKRNVQVEDLGADGRAECSICMDEVTVGEQVTVLPCSHWFHHQCISAWLGEHNTCPHCRKGINARPENPGDASSQPGTAERARPSSADAASGSGTADSPFVVSDSPERRRPSSSRRSSHTTGGGHASSQRASGEPSGGGGGIGDRIRNIFGSGRS